MKLEYVPLLQMQRELYDIPRGWERFRAYLGAMIDPESRDLKIPIVALNPMGKDHLPKLLDEYLAFDADALAARIVAETATHLSQVQGEFRVTLVVSDDASGGWTNRYTNEFAHRFQSKAYVKRGWLTGILWTSERPTAELVREEVLTTVHRGAYIQQHGFAETLRQMLAQESFAMRQAACTKPVLDSDDLACVRKVIAAHLDSKDFPTIFACLFGDEAANSLGYRPLGLNLRAGLALALQMSEANLL